MDRKCPNTELKEDEERKRNSSPRMTIAIFLQSKTAAGLNKNSKNHLEIFWFSGRASASPRQYRDIVAQIEVGTFHCEGVASTVDVENMCPGEDYIR